MGEGIRVIPGDNGPPIDLTAGGLAVPQYLGSFSPTNGVTTNDNGTSSCKVPGYTPGATMFIIPKTTVVSRPIPTSLIPAINYATGVSISGNTVTINTNLGHGTQSHKNGFFSFNAYQIPPRTNMSYGVTLNNTVNWLEVTSANLAGFCIWKGVINNTHSWTRPTIPGYSAANYSVFAHWDSNAFTLDWDGTNLTAWGNVHTGQAPKVNMMGVEIVIFCNGVYPTPHNGGLNIFNAKGQCTFSTSKAPFLLRGFVTTGRNPVAAPAGVAKMMVPLCRLGVQGNTGGGWSYAQYGGMRMAGNKLWSATGKMLEMDGSWTDHYAPPNPAYLSITLPVIDAANYF